VPDGKYELVLHFAELQGAVSKSLIYDLSGQFDKEQRVHRRFDVLMNDVRILENLDLRTHGSARPFVKKHIVAVKNGLPASVRFQALEGEAVPNAIELKKL
jgi:beta-galactosidase